jgi:hypothetical protein
MSILSVAARRPDPFITEQRPLHNYRKERNTMSTRTPPSRIRHTCSCGRLLGIQIADRFIIKHRGAKLVTGGGARVVCDGCKRARTFTTFDITRP